MFTRIPVLCLAVAAVGGLTPASFADDKKSDRDTVVAEGKELKLTPSEVVIDEKAGDDGRFGVTLKPAKAPATVKMPAEAYTLGFSAEPAKGGGLSVAEPAANTSLQGMRTVAGKQDEMGGWAIEAGDVITHVNGYAVNSIEEAVCAVSMAKDKKDVQIVVKDVNDGKSSVFYVTATKK